MTLELAIVEHAESLRFIIEHLHVNQRMPLRKIAAYMAEHKFPSSRYGDINWHKTGVVRLIKRLNIHQPRLTA